VGQCRPKCYKIKKYISGEGSRWGSAVKWLDEKINEIKRFAP
jgi:hypothetical protein